MDEQVYAMFKSTRILLEPFRELCIDLVPRLILKEAARYASLTHACFKPSLPWPAKEEQMLECHAGPRPGNEQWHDGKKTR